MKPLHLKPLHLMLALTAINLVAASVVLLRAAPPADALPMEPAALAPKIMKAYAFQLLGADGKVRAAWQVEADGEAVLREYGQNGEVRVMLGADDKGSALLLADDQTEPGVQLRAGINRATAVRDTAVIVHDGNGVSSTFK